MKRHSVLVFVLAMIGAVGPVWAEGHFHPASPDDSLVRYLERHGYESSEESSVLPSQVYASQPTVAARRGLVKAILKGGISILPGPGLASVLEASFGWKITDRAELMALAKLDDAALDRAADFLITHFNLERDPSILDRFPTLPLNQMTHLQEFLISIGARNDNPPEPLPFASPFPTDSDWQSVRFQTKGCDLPAPYALSPVFPQFGISAGWGLVRREMVPCYPQNSEQLAKLVNGLANTLAGRTVEGSITLDGSAPIAVRSYDDLAAALGRLGLTVEVYNTRVLVDFLGWFYRDHGRAQGQDRSIRLATWIQLHLAGKTISVPAEHGELALIVRTAKGERVAGLRWFFGIPDPQVPNSAAFWRPHTALKVSWSHALHEFANVYPPARTSEIVPYLDAAAFTMRGFQAVNDHYHPAFNGYGLYICSDSMVLALGKLAERNGGWNGSRLTDAFPVLYAKRLLRYETKDGHPAPLVVDLDRLFDEYAGVQPQTLESLAPPDQELQSDESRLQERLRKAFRPEDDARLIDFPDFRDGALKIIRN